jgi:hypothetical protein
MKRRKLLVLLAIPAGLLLGLYVVATLPAVQRAVALRAAARVPGLTLKIGRLSAGWGSMEVLGLEAEYRGYAIRIPQVQAEYSGMAFLLGRELHVQSLAVPDFVLGAAVKAGEATSGAAEPATASANPAVAFAGILSPISLPFPIQVDAAEIAGRVELPEGRALNLAVNGRLLAPGAEASTAVRLVWAAPNAAPGPVRELHWVGQLCIRETVAGEISQLGLEGLLAADAVSRSAGRGLRVVLLARHESAGGPETVEASVRLPAAKTGEEPLLRVKVEHRPGQARISGEWSVRGRREQMSVLAPGAAWPEFTAEAKGRFSYDNGTGDFSTEGRATAAVSQLRRLRPEFAGVDELRGQAAFSVERIGAVVTLSKLDAELSSAKARVLHLAALQPASYRLDTGAVVFAQPDNDLLRVELAALPVQWLQPWFGGCTVEGSEIVGSFAVAASADGRRVVLRAEQPLVVDALTVRRAGKPLLEGARIALSPRIEHNGSTERLLVPDLALTTAAGDRLDGSLDLTLDTATTALDFAGGLRGTLPTLLRPFMPVELGALQMETELAGTWRKTAPTGNWGDGECALRTAKAALRRSGGGPVLAVTALQPLTLRPNGGGGLVPERPGEPAVRLEFGGLPLAWAQPWLNGMVIGGTLASGECRLQGAGGAWALETQSPLVFAGVCLTREGRSLVEAADGELSLRGKLGVDAWAVEALDLQLRPGSLLPGGSVKLALQAQHNAAGHGSMKLPVTVDCEGRHSQLCLEGEWSNAGADSVSATARLTGDTVHLRDLSVLGALREAAAAAPTSAQAPSPGGTKKPKEAAALEAAPSLPGAKDLRPFWSALSGRLEVDIQRLEMERDEITGLQAVLVCDAQHLALEKLVGTTRSAPVDVKLGVAFDPAKALPYSLQGDCAVPGFDLGAFLRAAVPGQEPTLETVFAITAKMEGQGANLADLIDGVRGEFGLKGGPGVLRIKDRGVDKARALGGLVLGLLSKDKQKPVVNVGTQLMDELREFRFEQFDVSLLRTEDMSLQIRALDIRSTDKRFTGTGLARHVTGKTVLDYPLRLELRLAGKADFAALLEKVNLLDGSKDELGYLRMRDPFVVSGTMVKPDWKKMLRLFGSGLVFGK